MAGSWRCGRAGCGGGRGSAAPPPPPQLQEPASHQTALEARGLAPLPKIQNRRREKGEIYIYINYVFFSKSKDSLIVCFIKLSLTLRNDRKTIFENISSQ